MRLFGLFSVVILAVIVALLVGGCLAVPVAYEPQPPVVVVPAPVVIFPWVWVGPGWYGGHFHHYYPGRHGEYRRGHR